MGRKVFKYGRKSPWVQPRRPRGTQWGRRGRKGGTKVFKCGRKSPWVPTLTELFPKIRAIPHLFEILFVISWENNRDCLWTILLSLKTMEVQIKGSLWNKRFRTVQVYWKIQADAGSWLRTKNALYYCAQSANSFSWVLFREFVHDGLLSCHTCPVRSPSLCEQGKLLFSTFLTRNEGTTVESKKRLGYYQQEQVQFAPRILCFWLITMYRK